MSGLSSNRAINTFFQFSIERGDGSHARQLLDKVALSDPLKKQILELIASVPVPVDKREELDRLLGSDINSTQGSTQGKPAKIPTLSHPSKPLIGEQDICNHTLRVEILSFLDSRTLAQAMKVNSRWQWATMHGMVQQLRDQKTLMIDDISENLFSDQQRLLHLDLESGNNRLQYYKAVSCITGDFEHFDYDPWRVESRQRVIACEMTDILTQDLTSLFSYFPSLQHLHIHVAQDSNRWDPDTLKPYADRLQTLKLSHNPELCDDIYGYKQIIASSLEALAHCSQLKTLKFCSYYMLDSELLSVLCTQPLNLTALELVAAEHPLGDESDFGNDHCKLLSSTRWPLTSLRFSLDIHQFTFYGMQLLASAFPALTSLSLFYWWDGIGQNFTAVPSAGMAVLARSWRDLRHLDLNGVWTAEMIDTIMAGHPHLQSLTANNNNDNQNEWTDGQAVESIGRYGHDLTSLSFDNLWFNISDCRMILSRCTHLKSFELIKGNIVDEKNAALQLRAEFPQVNILIYQKSLETALPQ